jgi:1,4-alpha-glucan branching enzyme
MGAVFKNGSCTFRVWAPFAKAISVAGSFTVPPFSVPNSLPLARDNSEQGGPGYDYWSADVNGVQNRTEYKFIINQSDTNNDNNNEIWKVDPYCRDATPAYDGDKRLLINAIVDDPTFDWGDPQFNMPKWNELVIYEMHIGTFNNIDGKPGTFSSVLEKLDHLVELGVNAIEVMPAVEFESETSMGYNPSLLFAIDHAYGTQNAVKKFVQAAHAKGLAVLFDLSTTTSGRRTVTVYGDLTAGHPMIIQIMAEFTSTMITV